MAAPATTERRDDPDAPPPAAIPEGRIGPVTERELPEAAPLRKIIGPSVILVGVGISSGEYILYPYIASQVGLVFLWAAIVGLLTQYFINMEIERYTLATGETAITGFQRLWRPLGLVMVVGAILPNMWPGWAISGATITTFLFGGGDPTVIAIGVMILIGIALSASPVVYQTIEKLEFGKVAAVLVFVVVALTTAISATAFERRQPDRHELRHVPGRDRAGGADGRAGLRGRGRDEQPRPEQLDPRQGLRDGPVRTPGRLPADR